MRTHALLADKGYDADAIRTDLVERTIEVVIPGRSNRRVKIEHNRVLYKQRNRAIQKRSVPYSFPVSSGTSVNRSPTRPMSAT